MSDQTSPDIIVIDDDATTNLICRRYFEIIFPAAAIKTFTDPVSGLEYIRSQYGSETARQAYLFLDINMPVLSGWGVLDKFADFPDALKQHFTVYIFSSSVAAKDKEMADANPLVTGYIEKPLSIRQLQVIFPGIQIQV